VNALSTSCTGATGEQRSLFVGATCQHAAHVRLTVAHSGAMKKQTKRPLRLDRETIRELSQAKLQEVAGGNPTTTVLPTHCLCTVLEC